MSMTIARLAEQGGVGVETVRYYQRRELMAEPALGGPTGSRGVRRYGEDDVRRLRFIRAAQSAGFTLEQIRELLELDANNDRVRARALAAPQIDVLDRKIAELSLAREALTRLAAECGASSEGPCPILQAFDS
ncbi:MerR family transcriptional regulator (plasmid) [Sphingobium sp. SCG-1]|uniref:MerR family transcriptional regulator n=1 Tax=Sphingobium sp. SCG-1 TaxID=2072936 RepID=UPI000CD68A3F|nr:MerR family transcriptional regulator [Sphingobium sp. SCG-1]AUW60668.1 MerR family transcriptional regulator [Sphingobium sp. SCG-1]